MKITAVKPVIVNASLRNWVFVKVETDVDGLYGWGEATLEWKTRTVAGAVSDLTPVVVGHDPRRIEHLWQAMTRDPFFRPGTSAMSAISGIDQALWDINAKLYGVPAYELLGGLVRDRVRMYDHLGGGDSSAVYGSAGIDEFAASAAKSKRDGFTALKILAVPTGNGLPGRDSLDGAARLMAAVREAVGPEVDVIVDLHGRTTAAAAIAYARALEPHRPWFFEEPVAPGDTAALVEVARAAPLPVAAGERLVHLQEFREVLERRAVAILQPDVCHVGGPTGLRKIAALAESHGIPLAPHNPLGPIATAVSQHVAFATPGVMIQEVMRADVPWRYEVVAGSLDIVGGHVAPPTAVGWGVEVDEDAAAAHPYAPEPQLTTRAADGSVADW